MRPNRLNWKPWLSVQEAARRIAQDLGVELPTSIFKQPTPSQLLKDVLHDLHIAMSSGEVRMLLGDGSHDLDPRQARWDGFKIDLRKNRIEVGELQVRSYCELNASDLDAFLSKRRPTRFTGISAAQKAQECADWLRLLMAGRKRKSKDEYKKDAMNRFFVSGRAFDTLWKKIDRETGHRWSKAGRPKSGR